MICENVLPGKNKIIVGHFALGDDVGGAGQIQIGDFCTFPFHVDDQLATGHIDFDALAADLAPQGQNGDQRTSAGAAGIGEIFYATFEGALVNMVFAKNFIEVDVCALGESVVPTDLTAQFPQLVCVSFLQVVVRDYCVR